VLVLQSDVGVVFNHWTISNLVNSLRIFISLQPAWRHLPRSSEYSMISYRGSDIKMDEDLGLVYLFF